MGTTDGQEDFFYVKRDVIVTCGCLLRPPQFYPERETQTQTCFYL